MKFIYIGSADGMHRWIQKHGIKSTNVKRAAFPDQIKGLELAADQVIWGECWRDTAITPQDVVPLIRKVSTTVKPCAQK